VSHVVDLGQRILVGVDQVVEEVDADMHNFGKAIPVDPLPDCRW
jgi:hypothetical protein